MTLTDIITIMYPCTWRDHARARCQSPHIEAPVGHVYQETGESTGSRDLEEEGIAAGIHRANEILKRLPFLTGVREILKSMNIGGRLFSRVLIHAMRNIRGNPLTSKIAKLT